MEIQEKENFANNNKLFEDMKNSNKFSEENKLVNNKYSNFR